MRLDTTPCGHIKELALGPGSGRRADVLSYLTGDSHKHLPLVYYAGSGLFMRSWGMCHLMNILVVIADDLNNAGHYALRCGAL